jgi:hypothetical protein
MTYPLSKNLSLCGLLTVASFLQAAPFSGLVEDDVDVYFSLRSMAGASEDWAEHPFAVVLEDSEVQAFFEPLMKREGESEEERATEVLKNEFGLSWEEFFELFPGQLATAFYNLPELLLQQAERPEFVIMAEYAGEPEQLDALMQIQFERNAESHRAIHPAVKHRMIEESFMGETLHFDETFDGETTYIEDGYALVDGIFILATPEARLRSAVEAVKEAPASPLAENGTYLRSREEGGRGDLELYINLEAILPPLNAAMLEKAMASGVAMFGISAQSLEAALSLESLQAVFIDLDLIDEGLRAHSGVVYREKAGLLALLTYADEPLPEARYVPKGVFSTTVTNFDFGRMLAELEALLTTASPMMRTQIDAQLQTIRTHTGVDLRYAFLENFGGDLATLSILPDGARDDTAVVESDQVIVVGLKDAEALSAAFEALKDMVPGLRAQIETMDFAGETIHTIRAAPPPQVPGATASTVSYVITRAHCILSFGRLGLLQEVLSALESGADGFWQMDRTEVLFERIARPGAISRSYVNLGKIWIPLFQSMVQTSRLGRGAKTLEMERIPRKLSVPFHLISESNEADDGIFSRALILKREASE